MSTALRVPPSAARRARRDLRPLHRRPLVAAGAAACALLAGVAAFLLATRPEPTPPPAPAAYIEQERAPAPMQAAPSPTPGPLGPAPGGRVPPAEVEIPTIGVRSRLVDLGLNEDGTLEVPVDYALAGWFASGPIPGDRNGPPAVVVGHVDSRRTGPAVFYRLHELRKGDEVLIRRLDGKVQVFRVYGTSRFKKNAFPADDVYASQAGAELRLITCTGAFDRSAQSYEDNLVVYAELVGGR